MQPIAKYLCSTLLLVLVTYSTVEQSRGQQRSIIVPKMWEDAAMQSLEVPLSHPAFSPKHLTAEYYYAQRVRPIFRSYPVYAPGHEPEGYYASLQQKAPEQIAFNLTSEAELLRLGEIAFYAPTSYDCCVVNLEDVRNPEWYEKTGTPIAVDGTVPFVSYVIRQQGKVELGSFSCGFCHTRVMPDGSILRGAQGNLPFDRIWAYWMRKREKQSALEVAHLGLFGKPWLSDPVGDFRQMDVEKFAAIHEAIPPGVVARHRSSPYSPIQVPDLIGIKDRRYLDRTGLQVQRSIVDLMRYGALNQGADDLANFAGFIPFGTDNKTLPSPERNSRYADEHLFALASYLYSLQPPANPNPFDARAERGQRVFVRERCAGCHTPPLYTNNKLTPAKGFSIPADHQKLFDIMNVSVGTDPALTMDTRRGTGYYKVPSLKGLWYRGPLGHDGASASLEDWFDRNRLKEDYVPTGFKGAGVNRRSVAGHEFGLSLSAEDKAALIAFLKTL